MDNRRVVITGLGIISALGKSKSEFSENLFAGKSGIREIEGEYPQKLRFNKAAAIPDYDASTFFSKSEIAILDRFSQVAILAAREAIEDSGITWETEEERAATAVITGTGAGGLTNLDDFYAQLFCEGKRRFPPLIVPKAMGNAAASHISMEYGLYGPTFTTSTACSSSNHAIGQAFWTVRNGAADCAITGGSETPLTFGNLKAWEGMRVVSKDTCRPFSQDRSGMILGEGGGMLVIETLDSAKKRGANIYAEIVGFGMSADAGHITKPSAKGAARAISSALKDADIETREVGYINAHGTGTQANDEMEAEAINLVFEDHRPAVSSTKSMHGHSLGAAGAIEAVVTTLAVSEGKLPPTANFTELDPECDIDVIQNKTRTKKVGAAISNSFAFGGLNASLVFRAWDDEMAS